MSEILDQLRAPFPRESIHWRAQTVTKDGKKAMALAYLDARDVRERLNEVVGPENWTCEHYDCGNGRLGCRLSLRIGEEWITKTDGAGDTQVEAEKGAFSAALKRAAVAWGIGEYLYDLPAPWVPCETGQNGKFRKFTADPWNYVKGGKAPPAKKEETPVDENTGEVLDDPNEIATREIITNIGKQTTLTLLSDYWEGIQYDYNNLPEEHRKRINREFNRQKAAVGDGHNKAAAERSAA